MCRSRSAVPKTATSTHFLAVSSSASRALRRDRRREEGRPRVSVKRAVARAAGAQIGPDALGVAPRKVPPQAAKQLATPRPYSPPAAQPAFLSFPRRSSRLVAHERARGATIACPEMHRALKSVAPQISIEPQRKRNKNWRTQRPPVSTARVDRRRGCADCTQNLPRWPSRYCTNQHVPRRNSR